MADEKEIVMQNPMILEWPEGQLPRITVYAHPNAKVKGCEIFLTAETDDLVIGLIYDAATYKCYPYQIATTRRTALESDDFFKINTYLHYIMPNLKAFGQYFYNENSKLVLGVK
jgi:hypothetical protein